MKVAQAAKLPRPAGGGGFWSRRRRTPGLIARGRPSHSHPEQPHRAQARHRRAEGAMQARPVRASGLAADLEHHIGERQRRRADHHEAAGMRAAKRGEVTDAGASENDRRDDAEELIAALHARDEDGDAEDGPSHRRNVKDHTGYVAHRARGERAGARFGVEWPQELALADQRMADRAGDAEDGCSGGEGDSHGSASISPIFRCTRFTAFKGRIMTLKFVIRPSSPKVMMSTPLSLIPSISFSNSRTAPVSLRHSPT